MITEKYILVCDDFRREDNGKIIILGLYFDEMHVPALPFLLPTLTIFSVFGSDANGTFPFRFRFRHEEGGGTLQEGQGTCQVADHMQPIALPVKMAGLQLRNEGFYTFSLEFEGQAPFVATINVRRRVPGAIPLGGPPRPPA